MTDDAPLGKTTEVMSIRRRDSGLASRNSFRVFCRFDQTTPSTWLECTMMSCPPGSWRVKERWKRASVIGLGPSPSSVNAA